MFRRLMPLLILGTLIIPSLAFLLRPGVYWNMHDDMQLVRQLEMEKCLNDGQLPCRWTTDLGYGYGYPLFNFYPPFPYYVGQVVRLTGLSFISTIKITATLQFIVAALGMYLLASRLFGVLGGIISSLLYTYAPYHAVNIYVRGAMNEAWAAAFFPYIFYFSYQAINQKKLRDYLLLALSYSLLLLSHNPMALIFSPFLAVWILYWLIRLDKSNFFKLSLNLGLSLIFSILLSAYFTLPVIFESKLVQIESMFQNYYHYSVHFVSLYQLFVSNFWGDGPSVWGTADGMSFSIGYLHWIIPLICLVTTLIVYFKTKRLNILIVLLSALSVVSLFLTHARSTFIWAAIPIIQRTQFPWRFLNISTFLLSLLAGTVTCLIPLKVHSKLFILTTIVIATYSLNIKHFTPVTSGPINDSQKFSGLAWTNQITGGIYDYLPKTAGTAPKAPADTYIDAISPSNIKYELSGQKKGTDWLSFNISLPTSAQITLPVLYFPNYLVSIDNNPATPPKYETTLGRITVDLSSGSHQVYLQLHDTPVRSISNFVSLFSLLLFFYLFTQTLWKHPRSNR